MIELEPYSVHTYISKGLQLLQTYVYLLLAVILSVSQKVMDTVCRFQ